ncbi:MAG: alkaline phosphatase [Deltaproteobacteria bacterium]|nr:alkaline phosphatase [Deltaproteobacteria bacterium]
MKRKNLSVILSMTFALIFMATVAGASQLKYVFFFLGDGMASSQIQATEAYLTTLNGGSAMKAEDLLQSENRLNMSKMPVHGMQTTYDAFALMTDSASAATAFACGIKTVSGTINMDSTKTYSYKSVAQLAHEQGRKVGIISSVSLDHATPAAYYASVSTRDYMNNIATQMAASGFEFFGGGGLVSPYGPKTSGDTSNNAVNLLVANGYTGRFDRDAIMALKTTPASKVVCINPWLQDAAAMPYAIDRPAGNLSLAEMTDVAIDNLYKLNNGGKGFFLMVEGGKVDWACHANDAMATIGDMLDFDNAIGEALTFYVQHPQETLIIVTGDHETGGMSIGHATTGYKAYYEKLLGQKNSFTYFAQNQWAVHKAANSAGYDWTQTDNLAKNTEMISLMKDAFGLDWSKLNAYQKEKLEDAYDKSMCGTNKNSTDANQLLYGSYEPIIVSITHILNESASIGWTTYSHTGVPAPVFAEGIDADQFSGFYDNTDIAKRIAVAMGIQQDLPVLK